MNIIEKTKEYSINCHRKTNHSYNGEAYEIHLVMVYEEAKKYSHLVPEKDRDNFLAAAWAHDVIEDCRETYNDVMKSTNKEVADLVYALTNEKGKNRKERANKKYYDGINKTPNATLLKLCDRIANIKYSRQTNSRMYEVYKKENENFLSNLNYIKEPFEDLKKLFETHEVENLEQFFDLKISYKYLKLFFFNYKNFKINDKSLLVAMSLILWIDFLGFLLLLFVLYLLIL